jgi:uncharacterized membrane protein
MGMLRALLTGAAFGAGAMYFFDPRTGRRRRAEIEGRLHHLSRRAAQGVDTGLRDLTNRAKGAPHKALSLAHLRGSGNQAPRGSSRRTLQRGGWPPGTRLIAATAGSLLMANCSLRRTPSAVILGTAGFGLFVRAVSNKPLETALGFSQRGYAVEIEKTLEINAPVDQVFEFFNNPENYVRISDVVTNVEVSGESFAKEMLIAGVPLRFAERFVCRDQEQGLRTVSEPQSAMRFMKQLQFESLDDERTRVHLCFGYTPPLGVVGHALASVVGCDAKAMLTELLMRAKFFLETGREPHDAFGRRRGTRPRQKEAGEHRRVPRSSGRLHDQPDSQPDMPRSSSTAQVGWKLPHGPGAPMDDVARPGIGGNETSLAPANNPLPEPTPAGGQFPPAV